MTREESNIEKLKSDKITILHGGSFTFFQILQVNIVLNGETKILERDQY